MDADSTTASVAIIRAATAQIVDQDSRVSVSISNLQHDNPVANAIIPASFYVPLHAPNLPENRRRPGKTEEEDENISSGNSGSDDDKRDGDNMYSANEYGDKRGWKST